MIQTPAAVAEFSNVSRTLFLDVLSGCCTQISIENTSTGTISVQNANLIWNMRELLEIFETDEYSEFFFKVKDGVHPGREGLLG